MTGSIIIFGVTIAIVIIFISQCRKPWGLPGSLIIGTMNRGHSGVTDWGLEHLQIGRQDRILDVGCGGGVTIGKLAGMAGEGTIAGIDYSVRSVAMARAKNRELIDAGRIEIFHGGVSKLP